MKNDILPELLASSKEAQLSQEQKESVWKRIQKGTSKRHSFAGNFFKMSGLLLGAIVIVSGVIIYMNSRTVNPIQLKQAFADSSEAISQLLFNQAGIEASDTYPSYEKTVVEISHGAGYGKCPSIEAYQSNHLTEGTVTLEQYQENGVPPQYVKGSYVTKGGTLVESLLYSSPDETTANAVEYRGGSYALRFDYPPLDMGGATASFYHSNFLPNNLNFDSWKPVPNTSNVFLLTPDDGTILCSTDIVAATNALYAEQASTSTVSASKIQTYLTVNSTNPLVVTLSVYKDKKTESNHLIDYKMTVTTKDSLTQAELGDLTTLPSVPVKTLADFTKVSTDSGNYENSRSMPESYKSMLLFPTAGYANIFTEGSALTLWSYQADRTYYTAGAVGDNQKYWNFDFLNTFNQKTDSKTVTVNYPYKEEDPATYQLDLTSNYTLAQFIASRGSMLSVVKTIEVSVDGIKQTATLYQEHNPDRPGTAYNVVFQVGKDLAWLDIGVQTDTFTIDSIPSMAVFTTTDPK